MPDTVLGVQLSTFISYRSWNWEVNGFVQGRISDKVVHKWQSWKFNSAFLASSPMLFLWYRFLPNLMFLYGKLEYLRGFRNVPTEWRCWKRMKIVSMVRAEMSSGGVAAVSPGPFWAFLCLIKIVEKELIRGVFTWSHLSLHPWIHLPAVWFGASRWTPLFPHL